MDRVKKYYLGSFCLVIFTFFMVFIGVNLIEEQIIKNNQINNCEILIYSYEHGEYTEAELRDNSTFKFSYYWGLENDYWECDKWFDKEKTIQELLR